LALTIGISVDHRRTNKSQESITLNVARLADYKNRLIVFPRRASKPKKGDSSAAEIADAQQLKGVIVAQPPKVDAFSYAAITEVTYFILQIVLLKL
jgi:large subunit ribosomal protein L13e